MRRIVLAALLLAVGITANAQNFTNKGTEFWAGFGHHVAMEHEINFPDQEPEMVLYFSAEQAAHVIVTVEGTSYREEYDVPANTVVKSKYVPRGLEGRLPSTVDTRMYTRPSSFGGTDSEGIFRRKGVHIVSDVPIVAYSHVFSNASSAATMLIPVEAWGYAYRALTVDQTITPNTDGFMDRFSWLFVVSTHDNTRVRIIPSVPTRGGKPANVPIEVTLNKGEVYQLLGGYTSPSNLYSVSGTVVQSIPNSQGECFPVASFVGASGVHISCPGFTGRFPPEEVIVQQMFPIQAWGQRYATTPTSYSEDPVIFNNNLFLVSVKDPSTVVKRNGVVLTGMNNLTYQYYSNTPDYIEADKPISLAQAIPSIGACNYIGRGDPELMYLSPIEQGIKQTGFFLNRDNAIDWNLVSITVPSAGLSSLTIDGAQDFSYTTPHPNLPGYTVVVKRWRSTIIKQQCHIKCDSAFTAVTYGLGNAETYGYNVGAYINNLSGIAEIRNVYNTSDTANPYTCVNTPVKLSVLMRYKPTKLNWRLSQMDGIISPAADVLLTNPVPDATVEWKGVTYYRYTLPAEYKFLQAGKHIVPLYATHPTVEGCENTEKIQYEVDVRAQLFTDFDIVYQNCKQQELIAFNGREKFTNDTLIRQWLWTFADGASNWSANGIQVSRDFTAGQYTARLLAIDANACVADTSKQFRLSANPVLPVFTAGNGEACEGANVTIRETTPEAGVKEWFWDFGDGQTTTLTANGQEQTHTYVNPGTYTIKHVSHFGPGCSSDTASFTITVYAKPTIGLQYPGGCLPVDGRVQFTSTATAGVGQQIASHAWDFGDPAATPANPNTSGLANPVHLFAQGSYTIKYSIATDKGCASDTSFTAQLNLKPVLAFANPAIQPLCENNVAPVSVAFASVTNNVPGTGIYKGPGISSTGMLQASTAGAGNHTVWYVFTSSAGCTDSIASNFTVYAQPKANFTSAADVCLGQSVLFTDNSTLSDPAGSIVTWNWNFGDGTAPANHSTNQPFNHLYPVAANYNVQLTVISDKGCTSAPFTNAVKVHPLPVASFELPGLICMPGGTAAFRNNSKVEGGISLGYQWSFGDGQQSSLRDPMHNYTAVGNYTIRLEATSAFGCADDTTMQLTASVFKNKPVAAFSVTPERICQGSDNSFTDQSNAAESTITTWNWSFGDGSLSNLQNPVKRYGNFGQYTVSLQVTNAEGCVSDIGPASQKQVTVLVQPEIDAGPNVNIAEGTLITLQAAAKNEQELRFQWSPGNILSNPNVLRPTYLANRDQWFRLTAIGGEGECTATDSVFVKILRPVKVPNVFSPNGDGINDRWIITNLADYAGCTVEVFNRYGQIVYSSTGYGVPWDGTRNGNPLPAGTYYYIINLKNGFGRLSGSITILR